MGKTMFRDMQVETAGELPAKGAKAPSFTLTAADLSDVGLAKFAGKKKILNVFPSIDTAVCALSVKTFEKKVGERGDAVVVNVSADLPFAHKRFCSAEGIPHVVTGSAFRSSFGDDYGLRLVDGPFRGLLARAVVVVDEDDHVLHAELVPSIGQEPNYDAALAALG